jgi:hypothetical protein
MQTKEPTVYNIAYKWVSYCLVFAFIYYWFFTLGIIFFYRPVQVITPRQTWLNATFLRQEWRLFEIPRVNNRKMNFIIRDKRQPAQADTIDLVQYSIAQKRKYAPFNNYEDALERLLSNVMNRLEVQVLEKKANLQKKFPGETQDFYLRQVSQLTEADTAQEVNLQNIIAFGKHILEKEKVNTTGKEYQLSLVYKMIPSQNSTAPLHNDEEIIFITAYRNF